MLEVGNGGMTHTEYRTHMSLWSLLAAPLLAGNDLEDMSPETIDLLTNPEVIAINQDPLGRQARRVAQDGDLEVWAKPLADGRVAAGLFNRGEAPATVTARWTDLELADRSGFETRGREKISGPSRTSSPPRWSGTEWSSSS